MIGEIFHKYKSTKITKSGFTTEKWVNRTCDECGKVGECRLQVIKQGRERRGEDIDLCKKCSNSPKYKFNVFSRKMEDSVNWKGGESVDQGYLKVYIGNGKRIFKHVQIYEKHIGRKLTKKECLHHIDLNKLNNDVSNLYLCKNKREHQSCHQSMQKFAATLFNKFIWLDRNNKIYKAKFIKYDRIEDFDIPKKYNIFITTGCRKSVHSYKIEKVIGRKLYIDECVHHIDCNSLNNDVNNLFVLTRSEHSKIHKSLENCAIELYKKGLLIFDKGEYQLRV